MDQGFTTFQAKKVLGIEYGRLRDWIERGLIPWQTRAAGQGTKTIFSLYDLYALKLFSYLLDRGFSREEAATWFQRRSNYSTTGTWEASAAAFIKPRSDKNKPAIILLDENGIKTWTIESLGRAFDDWDWNAGGFEELDDIVIVNLKKIRETVHKEIRDKLHRDPW
jgi:DNA-binding transcriptional MerR regulator